MGEWLCFLVAPIIVINLLHLESGDFGQGPNLDHLGPILYWLQNVAITSIQGRVNPKNHWWRAYHGPDLRFVYRRSWKSRRLSPLACRHALLSSHSRAFACFCSGYRMYDPQFSEREC